ncbi:hypothetical protein EGJ55_11025 [Pseudomonas moraviensis]|nr:hypothetical protein EGJ55_11025 [Pseudomonas moraviensis]
MMCLVWRLREQARSHRDLRHIPEINRFTNPMWERACSRKRWIWHLLCWMCRRYREQARSYNGAGSTRNASTTRENAGDGWRRLG